MAALLTLYPSPRRGRRFRNWCVASTIAAALLLAGCGEDEDDSARTTSPSETAPSTATGTGTTTDLPQQGPPATGPREPERAATAPDGRPRTAPASPEDRPGGAGDEIPARSHALFTGRAGRIRPRLVKVPPFISIRVELRSADGRRYSLRFGTRSIAVGRKVSTTSTIFAGLRPGRRLTGTGPAGHVAVEASAEPGP